MSKRCQCCPSIKECMKKLTPEQRRKMVKKVSHELWKLQVLAKLNKHKKVLAVGMWGVIPHQFLFARLMLARIKKKATIMLNQKMDMLASMVKTLKEMKKVQNIPDLISPEEKKGKKKTTKKRKKRTKQKTSEMASPEM